GRKDLRSLLIESAHSILRSSDPLAQWGKKLLARKGELKLTVAAVARKLTVAVWYLMMGQWTPLTDLDAPLKVKVTKIITTIGKTDLKTQGTTPKQLRQHMEQ